MTPIRPFIACSCLFMLLQNAHAKDYMVDDSYTVGQRFAQNKKHHPELEWPVLTFEKGQTIQFDLAYKHIDGRDLHLDVFKPRPDINNQQAIVLIHGGGWRSGNKSHFYALANLLSKQGYTVITPEYRLSIEAQYPAGLIDISDAVLWVKSQSKMLNINAENVAIGGGSSGGHMAGLFGTTTNQSWFKGQDKNSDTSVNAIIDLDGVLDFTHPLAIANENKRKEKSAAGLWFGGAMEDTMEKWTQASTTKHINRKSPPMLIISSGQLRFTAGKDEVLEKYNHFDIPIDYFEYENNIHTFWLFEPYVSETAARIDTFLKDNVSGE